MGNSPTRNSNENNVEPDHLSGSFNGGGWNVPTDNSPNDTKFPINILTPISLQPESGKHKINVNELNKSDKLYLYGSWNNWTNGVEIESQSESINTLQLYPYAYQYKFKVNDEWMYDPNSPTVVNSMGSKNNVVAMNDFFSSPKTAYTKTCATYEGNNYDNIGTDLVLDYYQKRNGNVNESGVWLYRSANNHRWWICPASINDQIEREFMSGSKSCTIPTVLGSFTIDFVDKLQRLNNGVPRPIARLSSNSSELTSLPVTNYEWVFVTSKGDRKFDPVNQQLLTDSFLRGDASVNFNIYGNTYVVKFADMIQQNTETGKIHLIRFKKVKNESISNGNDNGIKALPETTCV